MRMCVKHHFLWQLQSFSLPLTLHNILFLYLHYLSLHSVLFLSRALLLSGLLSPAMKRVPRKMYNESYSHRIMQWEQLKDSRLDLDLLLILFFLPIFLFFLETQQRTITLRTQNSQNSTETTHLLLSCFTIQETDNKASPLSCIFYIVYIAGHFSSIIDEFVGKVACKITQSFSTA